MANEFNVGFSKFREAYEFLTLSEDQPEFDFKNTIIQFPNYDKHEVFECLECGTLTTDTSKHELRFHR